MSRYGSGNFFCSALSSVVLPELDVPLMKIIVEFIDNKKREPLATPVFMSVETLLVLFGSLGFTGFGRYESMQFLHQAALAAGGGVLVDHAFFSSFIESADRLEDEFFGLGSFFLERCACLTDGSPGCAAHVAIVDAALFVLLISFDL